MSTSLTFGGLFIVLLTFSHQVFARNVNLNGIDISSARNQSLENVNIRIDALGNIYIEAPHYTVHQENTFLPLGNNPSAAQNSRHKSPGMISSELSQTQGQLLPKAKQAADTKTAGEATATPPANAGESKLAPKEGDKVPAANH